MQISEDKLDSDDRPLARRWALGVLGIYGSILLGMILYAQFGPKPDVFLAVHEAAGKHSSNGPGMAAPEMARNNATPLEYAWRIQDEAVIGNPSQPGLGFSKLFEGVSRRPRTIHVRV